MDGAAIGCPGFVQGAEARDDVLRLTPGQANTRRIGTVAGPRGPTQAHLAMRGAPAKAIQELAGHSDRTTTMRYLHLSPAARQSAIGLLNRRGGGANLGEMLETSVRGDKSPAFFPVNLGWSRRGSNP